MRPILSGTAGAGLRNKAESYFEEYIATRRMARLSRPEDSYTLPRELIPRVLTSTCMGLASWWLDHPGAYSAREMAGFYLSYISSGSAPRETGPLDMGGRPE